MPDADLAFAGAARQAELIRSRETSSRELVQLYLDRITRHDGTLNAYRVVFSDRALAEAAAADARTGDAAGPLNGVPIAIKDDMDVEGDVTTKGSIAHGEPATADAELVRRLREGGAVVLGKTNVPELMIAPFTETPWYGATRNPWDLDRTPGGSSGGSAAAVAAGLCAAATGSDGAGSIRIPAACCGLFGLKAQRGSVPTAPRRAPWNGMTIWGPITRRVADSARCYDAIRDGDGSFAHAAAREPGRLRVALAAAAPPLSGVAPDAEQLGAVHGTADLLREFGHDVAERPLDYPATAAGNVILRYVRGVHDEARGLPHAVLRRAIAAAEADAARLNSVFADGFDVAVTPMLTRRPLAIGEYEGRPALWALLGSARFVPWCGFFNHTGQPAAAVPAGFTGDGFPLSVQLVAAPGREDVLLSLSAQLERARDWPAHIPPLAA
jgi:amidase